jgi:hypothetical protein
MEALGALGFVMLVAHLVAHVTLSVAVGRARPARGVLALILPPLGMVWGWQLHARRRVVAYGATLVAFGLVVVAIRILR